MGGSDDLEGEWTEHGCKLVCMWELGSVWLCSLLVLSTAGMMGVSGWYREGV